MTLLRVTRIEAHPDGHLVYFETSDGEACYLNASVNPLSPWLWFEYPDGTQVYPEHEPLARLWRRYHFEKEAKE